MEKQIQPSLELVSYQVTELKNMVQDLTKKVEGQMQLQGERIGDLEKRVAVLEARTSEPSPLPAFVKFGTAALGILSALLGALAVWWKH